MHCCLNKYLPGIETDLKDNVIRVAQKIKDEEEQRELTSGGGYQFVNDILRARMVASSVEDLKQKVEIFENIPGVKTILYKPKFANDKSELRNVTIAYIWDDSFLCEFQIRLGEMPVLEKENHFLYEILRAETSL